MKKCYQIKVYGRVQGVNFRYFTVQKASELGLKGWVANQEDGSVLIVAEGQEEALEKLAQWAKKGPPLALVTKIEISQDPYQGEFDDFQIRY